MANASRDSSPASIALAGALSLAVAMGIGRFAFTPLLPLMIQGGQLDVAAGGWIAAANYAGYLVGAMTVGRLRWGAVMLSGVSLAATVLLTAAMALPLDAWGWSALRFAAGVASAWAFVGTTVWCLGRLAVFGQGAWASAVYAGVGAGIMLAGFASVAGGVAQAPAPAMWLWFAVLAAVLLLPVWLVVRDGSSGAPRQSARASTRTSTAPTRAAHSSTTGLIVCYAALGFGYILPATFLPVLARGIVEDPRVFGLAWPVFGLTAAISTFIAGRAMRRAGRIRVWAVSHVVMGIGVLLPSLWRSGLAVGLSALMVGGTFMIVTMAGVQEMRERAAGDATRLVGRMTAAFAVGQIAGPIASSLLLHVPAFRDTGLNVALQVAAASLLVSAAWLWHAGRSHRDQETDHARHQRPVA